MGLALPSALQPPCCSLWGSNRRGGSYPRIPTLHPNPPAPQAPRLLCSLSLTSVLFVPRFPSPDGGCTTPARVSLAWPAYGLLPANSNVYRTSEKKMSFFSRSYSALQRATRRSLFLVIVMNKVLAGGNPFPYFPASPTLKLKMRYCVVVAKVFGTRSGGCFYFGVSKRTSAKAILLSEGRSLTLSEPSRGLRGSSLTPE